MLGLPRPSTTVVIAEDQAMFLGLLRAICEKELGFRVVGAAQTGAEATALCRDHQPRLILLDIGLPDGDGLDMIPGLKAESPSSRILVISALNDDFTMSRIVESGADGFLDKRQDGNSIERLANAIAAVLDVGYYWSRVVHDVRAKLFGNPRCWIKILTPREIDIVRQIAVGRTDLEAAQRLGICEATVKWHRHSVMAKLGLRRERQLIRFANHVGLSRMHS